MYLSPIEKEMKKRGLKWGDRVILVGNTTFCSGAQARKEGFVKNKKVLVLMKKTECGRKDEHIGCVYVRIDEKEDQDYGTWTVPINMLRKVGYRRTIIITKEKTNGYEEGD